MRQNVPGERADGQRQNPASGSTSRFKFATRNPLALAMGVYQTYEEAEDMAVSLKETLEEAERFHITTVTYDEHGEEVGLESDPLDLAV